MTLFTLVAAAASMPPGGDADQTAACPGAAASYAWDEYPPHTLSPEQSRLNYDTIVVGEVLVPEKPCSIGTCVGLRVITRVKGQPSDRVILRLDRTPGPSCQTAPFQTKGETWVVFAHAGTTPGGQPYLDAGADSPAYRTRLTAPNFSALEARFRQRHAHLDGSPSGG